MVYIGEAGGASEETLKAVRKEFGLDESISEQLFIYGKKLLPGDFGFSYFQGKPVLDLILEKIWATALLVLTAMLIAVTVGVLTGVIVAQRPASPASGFITIFSLVLLTTFFGPLFYPINPFEMVGKRFIPPGGSFPLGTDYLGRDVLAGIIHGAKTSFFVGIAILFEAGLSFLGLGDPNVMSWGYMIGSSRIYIRQAWWTVTFPGLAIFITVLSLSLVGDWLNDFLNPKIKGRRQG